MKTEELTKLLKNTKNLILHGAPGTGKTFLAYEIAKEMGCTENEICFVQFHPSYDYTDFVEGIRPQKNNSDIADGFVRMDGTFKKFCKKCIGDDYKRWDDDIESQILELITDYFKKENNLNLDVDIEGTIFKYTVCLKDEVIKMDGNMHFWEPKQLLIDYLLDPKIVKFESIHKVQKQVFKYIYNQLKQKINNFPFVFIIDEINRGELSKIFGELFFSIDPDYRGRDGLVQTQYQNLVPDGDVFKKGFYVPENVYIIGTMNDIDRSLESMDFAMRRRFTFEEIKVEDTQDDILAGLDESIRDEAKIRMNLLNNAISETEGLSSSYHIGAAYFLKLNNLDNKFELLWKYNLKPLLQEYLRGQGEEEEKLDILKAAYDSADNANAENAS